MVEGRGSVPAQKTMRRSGRSARGRLPAEATAQAEIRFRGTAEGRPSCTYDRDAHSCDLGVSVCVLCGLAIWRFSGLFIALKSRLLLDF